jgi:hypothetical protein
LRAITSDFASEKCFSGEKVIAESAGKNEIEMMKIGDKSSILSPITGFQI